MFNCSTTNNHTSYQRIAFTGQSKNHCKRREIPLHGTDNNIHFEGLVVSMQQRLIFMNSQVVSPYFNSLACFLVSFLAKIVLEHIIALELDGVYRSKATHSEMKGCLVLIKLSGHSLTGASNLAIDLQKCCLLK